MNVVDASIDCSAVSLPADDEDVTAERSRREDGGRIAEGAAQRSGISPRTIGRAFEELQRVVTADVPSEAVGFEIESAVARRADADVAGVADELVAAAAGERTGILDVAGGGLEPGPVHLDVHEPDVSGHTIEIEHAALEVAQQHVALQGAGIQLVGLRIGHFDIAADRADGANPAYARSRDVAVRGTGAQLACHI